MSKARQLADLLDSNGDVVVGALDNAPDPDLTPYATNASLNTLQTQVDNITTDVVSDTTPQLGGNLDTNGNQILIKLADGTEKGYIRSISDVTEINGVSGSALRHNSVTKLETGSYGVNVSGQLDLNNQKLFHPVANYWSTSNPAAQSGWKTIRFANVDIGANQLQTNNERFVAPYTGWYWVSLSHAHGNGYHNAYYTRVYHSSQGTYLEASAQGDRINCNGFVYMGTGEYFFCQTYHSNASHTCNTDRRLHLSVYYLNGA